MKNKLPRVSIIIVNWNGGKILEDCIKSLLKIDYHNWELIIVDNGSTDGSENIAANFKLIKNSKNLGFVKANNQGLKKAKGKYILLLNNDTKVEKNFLSKLVKRVEQDPTIAVIQPKIYLMDKLGFLDNCGSFLTKIGFLHHWGFNEKERKEFGKEREIFSAKGACMLIRRQVVNKIGLFDKDFFSYFEESDFCWRVWLTGNKVLFYPGSIIYHKLGFTIRRLGAKELNYHYYKNRICSLIKNLETKNLLVILFLHIFISIGIALAFLLKFLPQNSLLIIRAIFWNIFNLPRTLKKRAFIQRKRTVSDKELFRNLMYSVDFKKFFSDFKRVEQDIKRLSAESGS